MIQLLDIPRKHHCSLSNVKLILVINNYFLEFNEVLNGLRGFMLFDFSRIESFLVGFFPGFIRFIKMDVSNFVSYLFGSDEFATLMDDSQKIYGKPVQCQSV